MKLLFSLTVLSVCAFRSLAAECSVTLSASDTGWYEASGFHDPQNINYFVGQPGGVEFRNWFVFDLPSFPNNLVAASLRVFTFEIQSTNDRVTLELHQVATSLSALTNGGAGLTNVFEDLGDGDLYV